MRVRGPITQQPRQDSRTSLAEPENASVSSDRSRIMSPCDMAHDEDGAVMGNRAPFSPLAPGLGFRAKQPLGPTCPLPL